ncbi:MAG: hypothetical protein JKY70_20105 [Mucilaginibacter sp.]|nr:hypothetical protein [Mucilaginibacter sp.]
MNFKPTLPIAVLLSFSILSCKKSSSSDTDTTTSPVLQASIGGNTWTPDTVSASITYNASLKTKTFYFKGTKDQKQIEASVQDYNPVDNQNFSGGSYVADNAGKNTFIYSTQIKNSDGAYVFEPFGTVQTGNGNVTITAIDSAAKTISGSFYFSATKPNYDANGNLISVDVAGISGGTFTKLPFQQVRQ